MNKSERDHMAALTRLWDMLADAVNGERLSEDMIPDDFEAFTDQMAKCQTAYVKMRWN